MRNIILVIVLLITGVVGGCDGAGRQLVKVGKSNIEASTGNLIALWMTYRDKEDVAIVVTEPYAVYMEWRGDDKLFYLYDNVQKITYKTTNFDAFLEGLEGLAAGTKIQRFDTCTATQLYDIPRSKSEKLAATLSDGKLSWATSKINGRDKEIFCYCRSRGFRYP